MSIIGFIILGLSILIAFSWCLHVRNKAKAEQATEKSMELQGFLMTISIILIPLLHLSPFHLIWMIPSSFILGLLSINTPLKILWFFSSLYFSIWYIGIRNEGRQYYVTGEYENAINAYKKEISKNPSAEAYFNLGLAYGKIGEFNQEIAAYEEAVKLNPKRPELLYNLGLSYKQIGNKEKALTVINDAIRLKPEYLKAHYTICKMYSELGDHENAFREFEIIEKMDARSAEELRPIINQL